MSVFDSVLFPGFNKTCFSLLKLNDTNLRTVKF